MNGRPTRMTSCSDFGHHTSCHTTEASLPCCRHRPNPGWRLFTANRWEDLKEDTSAGGNKCTALIRKEPIVLYRFSQRWMCVFVRRLLHSRAAAAECLFCQNPNHNQLFTQVNFCGHSNIYDSHPFFVYSPPSFCSSLWPHLSPPCAHFYRCHPSLPFSALSLFIPPPPLPHLPVLPCPRPAPIGYHLTCQCVLGSIQWQRHIALLSLYTVSLLWNLCTPTFL